MMVLTFVLSQCFIVKLLTKPILLRILNKVTGNKQTMFTSRTAIEFNSHGYVTVPSFRQKTYESGAGDREESMLLDSVPITVSDEILTK